VYICLYPYNAELVWSKCSPDPQWGTADVASPVQFFKEYWRRSTESLQCFTLDYKPFTCLIATLHPHCLSLWSSAILVSGVVSLCFGSCHAGIHNKWTLKTYSVVYTNVYTNVVKNCICIQMENVGRQPELTEIQSICFETACCHRNHKSAQ